GGPSGGVASGGGLSLFAVRGGASGLERTALTTMDQTRRQARLVFSATPAQLVGLPGEAGPGLERTLQLAAVALAAEQVGGAQRCLEMAVDYAQARVQFGRPIGSFQAVKHRLAEMLVEVEQARSAAYMAGWVAAAVGERGWASADAEPSGSGGSGGSGGSNGLSEGGGAVAEPGRWNGLREGRGLALLASVAKAYCSDAYFHAAEGCIQVHGGIGFTWEHDAHLYFKRAKSSQLALGDPTYHRELVASSIGL
ncbi:MAG: acyl-CoA dehydrogenase family protein, partial [Acidimicrobiales bacterium]